jgi:hypothetical protein
MARYDNADTVATLIELIPTLIAPGIVNSAARQEVFRPLTRQFDLTGIGGALNVPTAPALTFASLTENTAPDVASFDTGMRVVNPVIRGVDTAVSIMAWEESATNVMDAIISEVAIALVKDRDGLFAALYTEAPASGPTHEIGTDGTELNFTIFRTGQALLYKQNAPRRFAWAINSDQWVELLKDDTMINAALKGSPVLTQGVGANGFLTSVLDTDLYMTDQIVASSGTAYQSMMFSKMAALGYGFKRIASPLTPTQSELLIDLDWDSSARAYNINSTYYADAEGIKGTSTTTNNYLVAIVS